VSQTWDAVGAIFSSAAMYNSVKELDTEKLAVIEQRSPCCSDNDPSEKRWLGLALRLALVLEHPISNAATSAEKFYSSDKVMQCPIYNITSQWVFFSH